MSAMRKLLVGAVLALATTAASAETAPAAPQPALMAAKAAHGRLLGIAAAGKQLLAVGQQGVILQSQDGQHWQQLPSPVSSMLNRVRFLDPQHGWIVGYDGSILGNSWQLQHFDAEARALHDVLFISPQRGIAVGAYGTVLTTDDGGGHWLAQDSVLAELALHLNSLVLLRDGALIVVGEGGLIARSEDQGQSWKLLKSPYIGSWFGALPFGEKGMLLFGMRGNVYSTADASALLPEDSATLHAMDRESAATAAAAAALGWRGFDNPVQESLFGGSLRGTDEALLVGVNGVIAQLSLSAGTLTPMKKLRDEPLSGALWFHEQLLVVGRRGVQNLGAIQ
jgi:photosystem II stability/assembly factor-like uncharacterized protein